MPVDLKTCFNKNVFLSTFHFVLFIKLPYIQWPYDSILHGLLQMFMVLANFGEIIPICRV